jgi:hypothetical protein
VLGLLQATWRRPDSEDYPANTLGLWNICIRLIFNGAVTGIPAPTGDNRIFTVGISTFLRKESDGNKFSEFGIYCVLAGRA